jgi:hypothetical protein
VLGLDSFWSNIEKSINKRLLSIEDRPKFYVEFDRDALMRMDSAARGEFMSKMIQNGLKTPNELRKKNNDHPLEGGDILLINSTLIPLTTPADWVDGSRSRSALMRHPRRLSQRRQDKPCHDDENQRLRTSRSRPLAISPARSRAMSRSMACETL